MEGRKSLSSCLGSRGQEAAVGSDNEGRGVILTPVSRPLLGTLREAGEQRTGFPSRQLSRAPSASEAEVKAWYTKSLFIVSPAVQRSQTHMQAPHDSTWPLFSAGGIKWPVTRVQFSCGSQSPQEAGSGFACGKNTGTSTSTYFVPGLGATAGEIMWTRQRLPLPSRVWRERVSGDDLGRLPCEHV